jgi:hypothetical protein
MGYFGKDWLHQQKSHEALAYIWVLGTQDGIIMIWARVISTQYEMIPTWARLLNIRIGMVHSEIGLNPTGKIISRMHEGMLWMTLSMRKTSRT